MSVLAHEGHDHGAVLTFSVRELGVLLVLAVLAFVLNGGSPRGARLSPHLTLRRQLPPVLAGVAGLGVVVPVLMWAAHALGMSIGVAQVAAFVAVAGIATAVARLAHQPRPWLVGLLGFLGFFVAFQLSMIISPNGIGPAAALAAMTMFSVALPAVTWRGQAIRVAGFIGCWALMSVLSTQPWATPRIAAAFATLVAGAAALAPVVAIRAEPVSSPSLQRSGHGRHDVPAERLGS
jgi:hypothetical protein